MAPRAKRKGDKPAKEVVADMPKRKPAAEQKSEKPPRRTVRLTHPDRIYGPAEGVTKEGLADYYSEAGVTSPRISSAEHSPFCARRPA